MTTPPEYLAELERQVTDAHERYTKAVGDSARAQLLLLCHEVRDVAPEAAALVFEDSDQGDFLDLVDTYDSRGRIINWPSDGIEWDANVRSWDLDTDKPASRDVWEPLARNVGSRNSPRYVIVIDTAVAVLNNETPACAICSEPITYVEHVWTHIHGDQSCGTGDGSVAHPPKPTWGGEE